MIRYIDANCMVGGNVSLREDAPKNTKELETLHQRCGISGAVVFHRAVTELAMIQGNACLAGEISGSKNHFVQFRIP